MIVARAAITQAHHEEWARVVAALTRRFGDLDIAEEAAAEAFATCTVPELLAQCVSWRFVAAEQDRIGAWWFGCCT